MAELVLESERGRSRMKGQWIGKYTGSSEGMIIVNVDERSSYYQGVAYLLEDNPAIPATIGAFRTGNKDQSLRFRTDLILPIDPRTALPGDWKEIEKLYGPAVGVSKYADVNVTWDDQRLSMNWASDLAVTGSCVLPRSRAGEPSELVAEEKEWEGYKTYVAGLKGERLLFRGQKNPQRLRTAFHRTGRADLTRFLREDIQDLHKRLSARVKHVFDLRVPDENGAFFSLVQHHGYPTPLLDWTFSPYVAAFFAYRGISNVTAAKANPKEKVRVLIFDQGQWTADFPQPLTLANSHPYVSISEFLAIENERTIPQQAASMVTNVDDIEAYIRSMRSDGKSYLRAIDLPVRDRKRVIHELAYMGITAGSLFPGLDGACEELRERNFDIYSLE
jgi:hypothetical protein